MYIPSHRGAKLNHRDVFRGGASPGCSEGRHRCSPWNLERVAGIVHPNALRFSGGLMMGLMMDLVLINWKFTSRHEDMNGK